MSTHESLPIPKRRIHKALAIEFVTIGVPFIFKLLTIYTLLSPGGQGELREGGGGEGGGEGGGGDGGGEGGGGDGGGEGGGGDGGGEGGGGEGGGDGGREVGREGGRC